MYFCLQNLKKHKITYRYGCIALCCCLLLLAGVFTWRLVAKDRAEVITVSAQRPIEQAEAEDANDYIHWVEFSAPLEVLEIAMRYDIESYGKDVKLNWIELLAYAAAKNGGVFKASKPGAEMDPLVKRLQAGERMEEITAGMRYYSYYKEAYSAILGEFLGEVTPPGQSEPRYGLKVYSPIAKGYGFGHCDDFGNARTYGYKRLHLGNDLSGAIGTPIIAIEGGKVTALGWNQYGGWRVGIRSHDGLRYYYYAHLRKDHPYVKTLKEGDIVQAGDVIGYMGMTGYSKKENVNNIHVPHLHVGLQLIFDESQADGDNEIWIDVYQIIRLLQRSRMPVQKLEETGDYVRVATQAVETPKLQDGE